MPPRLLPLPSGRRSGMEGEGRPDSDPEGEGMGLSEEEEEEEGLLWAAVPSITFLGFVLLLLVAMFPAWVRLEPPASRDVLYSGPWGDCFQRRCRPPRTPSAYILLARAFLVGSVVLAFALTFLLVAFASRFVPPPPRARHLIAAGLSFGTGACVVLAGLMHGLQMKELARRPRAPHLTFLWPYSALASALFLFLLTGFICLLNHLPFWRGLPAAADPAPWGSRMREVGGWEALGRTFCNLPAPGLGKLRPGRCTIAFPLGLLASDPLGALRVCVFVLEDVEGRRLCFHGGDNLDLWPGSLHSG
ncbi:LOW QUALITY PROTEIN: transmembrane protein 225B [Tachyglossus aculeatus]|uniref:LOW QUALITY PROTEIN: transmembrane protein 225B n=1 Tax=Tachyglossus aculeatus TaxID=9261 RepID=UPI0018F33362|nr:LOW QUALITY PROTEIN: transmembrane protein 225B [Tachyglossus aculeatus]